jgi:signal peptidase I, bacterial type
MKNNIVKEMISWIIIFVLAIAIAVFINKVVIFKVVVPTGSMENTIMVGDRVITLRLSYQLHDPERGDIIVFPFPDDESLDYIKRIIGLPGETVEGKDGYVYINGKKLKESYVTSTLDEDFGPYVVPENSYFMMGDNRDASEDSRVWNDKFVKRKKIIGKALFKYPNFTWLN